MWTSASLQSKKKDSQDILTTVSRLIDGLDNLSVVYPEEEEHCAYLAAETLLFILKRAYIHGGW